MFLFQQESARATVPTTLTLYNDVFRMQALPDDIFLMEFTPVYIWSTSLMIRHLEERLQVQQRQLQNLASLYRARLPRLACFQVGTQLHTQCVLVHVEA